MKDKVLIVAADLAYGQFKEWQTYICQENRSFQLTEHMAFYDDREIKKEIPKILGIIESFQMSKDDANKARIKVIGNTSRKALINRLKSIQNVAVKQTWYKGYKNKFIFLSRNQNEGTVLLENTITNDKIDKNGNYTAFTMKHTYRNLNQMKKSKFTSQL